jgi:hypothetical protein
MFNFHHHLTLLKFLHNSHSGGVPELQTCKECWLTFFHCWEKVLVSHHLNPSQIQQINLMILEVTMKIKVHTKYNSTTCLGLAMHQSTFAITSLVDDHLLDTNTLSRTTFYSN